MFRIRKIFDSTPVANQDAIKQVRAIMTHQFPLTRKEELLKLSKQLDDPLQYRYRSILFVAENAHGKVKGFAMLLHMSDLHIGYLELISAAPGTTGGGVGGILYERVQLESVQLGLKGLFFECSIDDPGVVSDSTILKQNQQRLRFYERYNVFPIINNIYNGPVYEGDEDLYFLMYDALGRDQPLRCIFLRKIVRAILDRKYGALLDPQHIDAVAKSFSDDPIQFRAPRYIKKTKTVEKKAAPKQHPPISLVVNSGHDIHHVTDKGYVEAPVRIPVILKELSKTQLFNQIKPNSFPLKFIKQVHDRQYVDYFQRTCKRLPEGKSFYPIIFPLRNSFRPPKDPELQIGYYCMDTFTPFNKNAYLAARGAVDCAMTGATVILNGGQIAYALVRPPGHHAERRAFGGFCYFNSSAIAANYLSHYGRVAVLDVDFHHGNGTEDIFYKRADVLTVSIHGHPDFAYPHFSGFADEKGEGDGLGYNINYPLPAHITVERYHRTLEQALKNIKRFGAEYLVVALGLDTAKSDPTGTWQLQAKDYHENGRKIGALKLPTLIVQEGGYLTRTLGRNARHFFEGLWQGFR
ncbi:MAG: histone deacetylase family protein [Gammaproteobacteria bacterium]|nr:histone deacetylase family protein [Gammaproteobacteria bacterium]MDH5802689.1 histone deacetylase family protein [Gammaproteobacteria bacterium]